MQRYYKKLEYARDDIKKETRRSLILRSNPVDISREHGAFFDVGDAEEAGGDALEAEDGILTIELQKIQREEGKTSRQIAIS